MPLERQRELYERYAAQALDDLARHLAAHAQRLIALGAERAFEQVGVEQYGDSTYFRSVEQLGEEAEAELADAIFYLHVRLARQAGELPASD